MKMTQYDIIGDIHGHHDLLIDLLKKLDYKWIDGSWKFPGRKLIFAGDLIDRGPQQIETLNTVRNLVEKEDAFCVMGNHEYNAVCFATPLKDNPEKYIRPHNKKNTEAHKQFLDSFKHQPATYKEYIDWMRGLPIALELPGIRVIHACWHTNMIDYLKQHLNKDLTIKDEYWDLCGSPEHPFYIAIETVLKGPETQLNADFRFKDLSGEVRNRARITWWNTKDNSLRLNLITSETHKTILPETPNDSIKNRYIYNEETPVIFGHYWLTGEVAPITTNLVCVDYGAGKGEKIVAYRWSGENILLQENIVTT
jgi:hypothetical protein